MEENPTYEELKEWYGKSGLPPKKFFNTSGLIVNGDIVLVDFTEADWSGKLN